MTAADNQTIAQLGEAVLRNIAEPVDNIGSNECLQLVELLLATAHKTGAMGIAAPQIFSPKRIIVVSSQPNERYPNAPLMQPLVMINPVIEHCSPETNRDWEGCLSIPGIRASVERSNSVTVSYSDAHNHRQQGHYHGFIARIIQHEIDHLDGTVFIDRTDSHSVVTEQQWRKQLTSH